MLPQLKRNEKLTQEKTETRKPSPQNQNRTKLHIHVTSLGNFFKHLKDK